MRKRSITLTAAWITGGLGLIGTIILASSTYVSAPESKRVTSAQHISGDGNQASSVVGSNNVIGDNNVVTYPHDPQLEESVNDLQNKTKQINQLPDGRSLMGVIVMGKPAVLLDEHEKAVTGLDVGDFNSCFVHAQNAVKAHEETLKVLKEVADYGDRAAWLSREDQVKLYRLAEICATHLGRNDIAVGYRDDIQRVMNESLDEEQ